MIIPKNVEFVITELNKNGYEAFVVGGCVRDSILKREPKDFDITTSATPAQTKKSFIKTFDTGIAHGTITILLDGENIEVTTYRIDGEYKDNRHPSEVTFTKSLKEDLLRRDFTMNAIAYHKDVGFVDPFGGIYDISKKIIKGVGDPDKRFKEDALRMLRAVRFSSQLGFEIDEDTYNAIIDNNALIEKISVERIRDEIIKLIMSDDATKINMLTGTKLIKYVYEDLYDYLSKYQTKIGACINKSEKNLVIRLVHFLKYLELEKLAIVLKYFKIDTKTSKEVTLLIKNVFIRLNADKYSVRKYINTLSKDTFLKLLDVQYADCFIENESMYIHTLKSIKNLIMQIEEDHDCLFLKDLDISGDDLINLGVKKGQQIGEILNNLLDEVLKEPTKNTKKQLESMAISFMK